MNAIRDRLGSLCTQLSRWPEPTKRIIHDGGANAALEELLSVVGNVNSDPGRLEALLDAIEEACATQGLAGVTSREQGYQPLPIPSSLEVAGWTCPRNCCDRVVLPEEAQTAPACALAAGTLMKNFRALS